MAATAYRIFLGSANAGQAPTFAVFARADTGSPVDRPTISESPAGGGWYTFGYDWATAPAGLTAIQWSLSIGGADFSDVITAATASTTTAYVPPPPGAPLPGQATLGALRLLAQQRSDQVNSQFVTAAEWASFINGSWARLYGLLLEKFDADYYAPERFRFSTVGGQDTYPLPDGSTSYQAEDGTNARAFYKLLGVDVQAPGTPSGWLSLRPFPRGERNGGGVLGQMSRRPRYRLAKGSLWLAPQPQSGLTLRVLYAPRLSLLVNDADLVDGVNGWEEYVVCDAARKALAKEESDTSALEREIADIVARIEHEADNRDQGEPSTVADVMYGGGDIPGGWGPI